MKAGWGVCDRNIQEILREFFHVYQYFLIDLCFFTVLCKKARDLRTTILSHLGII